MASAVRVASVAPTALESMMDLSAVIVA